MPALLLNFDVTLGDLGPDQLRLVRFTATETISEGRVLELWAETTESFSPDDLCGKPGTVRVLQDDAPLRVFHGVLREVRVRTAREGQLEVSAQLCPKVELLRLGRDHRIFTDLDPVAVAKKVLIGAGIPAAAQKWNVATPAVREAIFQGGESDYAFLSRLMAEEGIGFAVHDDDQQEALVFFDDSSALDEIPGEPLLPMRTSAPDAQDSVRTLRESRRVASDAVMMKDHDFKRPRLDVSGKAKAPQGGSREIYVHPATAVDSAVAKECAQLRLEQERAFTRRIEGESSCARLRPAARFQIEGNARAALNGGYLLVSVTHDMKVEDGAASYSNRFTAIPSDTPFRPSLEGDRPLSAGIGFVTAPSGEDIHTDEFGRVKVRFPWDRSGLKDDRSSAWLRVGQVPMQGSVVLPRKDFEVGVHFEDGWGERPFVTGHYYNEESPPPYALPEHKTRSALQSATAGGGSGANELRFEDSAGAEEIFLNASKDFIVAVENDAKLLVGNNSNQKVDADLKTRVGATLTAVVGGSRKLSVGANQTLDVAKNLSESTGDTEKLTVGAMHKIKVGGDLIETSKGTFERTVSALQSFTSIKSYGRKITGNSETLVGAAWMEVVGGSRASEVKGNRFETVGAIKRVKAKQMSVNVEKALAITSAVSDVKVGGARSDSAKGPMALTASGGLSVQASTITMTAESSITIIAGGCSIKLSSSGEVKITAPTVELSGVKALAQVDHKSN